MLVNLSNHTATKWSAEQTTLAEKQFGAIVDLPFPNISPLLDTEGVVALAHQYLQNILALQKAEISLTVHLMGELSFCFALVQLLQQADIPVVCSTTERTILEEVDGKKTAQFHFHQFRAYPSL